VKVTELSISGLFLLESPVFGDERGFFREWFKDADLTAAGVSFHARQANVSMSKKNTVRGLHYSLAPEGQAKVVTCVFGELDDVIVDVRVGSPTYGRHEIIHLEAGKERSLYLPSGVAHGFSVPVDTAALSYLLSSAYNPAMELEINPFDPDIAVTWPIDGDPILSTKDAEAPSLQKRRDANQLPSF
jgi:dTDP-4-dehydrorhamnose 3,5-epimerase